MKKTYCVCEILYLIEDGVEHCFDSIDLVFTEYLAIAYEIFDKALNKLTGNSTNIKINTYPPPLNFAVYLRIEKCREDNGDVECLDVITEERVEYWLNKNNEYERTDVNDFGGRDN